MPVHTFNEIGLSFANGAVGVSYPNPAWGYYKGGAIDTATINAQITEALKHTETYTFGADEREHNFGEFHKVRVVNAGPAIDAAFERGKNSASVKNAIATANWMNNKTADVALAKNTTYHIYAVNSGINSYATGIKLKIKGADNWNIFAVTKEKGAEGTGGRATYTDLPSASGKIKSLSYVSNQASGFADITIVPKENITVTLKVDAYDGYGIAFIDG